MIKTLQFKAHSSRTPFIDLFDEKWVVNSDPYDVFINNISIDILGVMEENEDINDELYKTIKIGEISGTYFNVEFATNSGQWLWDLFDSYSTEAEELYHYLFDEDETPNSEYFELNFNVFNLDYIYIEEEYRNKGIGTFVLKQLDNILNVTLGHSAGCFVCIPLPTTISHKDGIKHISYDKEDKKSIIKLRHIMRSCGYRTIKGSEYLYKNNDRKTTELKLLWIHDKRQ